MGLTFKLSGRVYEVACEERASTGGGGATDRLSPRRAGERVRVGPHAARALLVRTLGDPRGIAELKRVLISRTSGEVVSRWSDAEVVEQVASHIGTGELRLFRTAEARRAYAYSAKEPVDEALGPEVQIEAEVIAEPEGPDAEVDTAYLSLDAAMQADALRQAAASGVPFCEECEKARRARAQTAAGA